MKTIKQESLHRCPLCGAKAVIRKNASKDFQIACTKCYCHTGWSTKPEAIATWYNNMIQMWKNNGQLTLDTPDTKKG